MKVHFEIVDKKPENHKWWIYVHTTPCGMHYVGMSSREKTSQRWAPSQYKRTSLEPYIERFGWENIGHTVVAYLDNQKLALQYEEALMNEFAKQGTLINKQGSGGHERDNKKDYMREYQQSEKVKALNRKAQAKYRATPEGKIYNRVSNYNQTHDPIETPLEAKQRYLNEGYIPDYIKHDDL